MHGRNQTGWRRWSKKQVSDWTKSGADAPCSNDDNVRHDSIRDNSVDDNNDGDNEGKDGKRRRAAARVFNFALTTGIAVLLLAPWLHLGHARDNGQFAGTNPELKAWFDSLRSGKGPCCSDADGTALSDVDWESSSGHYRVRLDGEWVDVPDDAVITVPNRIGRTMVWPMYRDGKATPRCFMPGSMT
jgi:hypothetical protein